MNKVILMGRPTKDPDTRIGQGMTPITVSRYTLAINKRFKKQGEPDADFINCVAFGKSAEFAEKFLKKGQMISVVGRLQTGSYEKDGRKVYTTDVVVEEHYFCGGKSENAGTEKPKEETNNGFYPIDENVDDTDLPF